MWSLRAPAAGGGAFWNLQGEKGALLGRSKRCLPFCPSPDVSSRLVNWKGHLPINPDGLRGDFLLLGFWMEKVGKYRGGLLRTGPPVFLQALWAVADLCGRGCFWILALAFVKWGGKEGSLGTAMDLKRFQLCPFISSAFFQGWMAPVWFKAAGCIKTRTRLPWGGDKMVSHVMHWRREGAGCKRRVKMSASQGWSQR